MLYKSLAKNKKMPKNKTLIALFLMFAMTFSLVGLPNANAANNGINVPQWAYISAFPSPVGSTQPISIFAWTANLPPTANGAYGDRWSVSVVVTAPDGTNTTLGPYTSDPVGTIFTYYTPLDVGNYTFQAFVDAHKLDNTPNGINPAQLAQAQLLVTQTHGAVTLDQAEAIYVQGYSQLNNTYAACVSHPVTVTVQQEAIPLAPDYPLPSEYWSSPVSQAGHQSWGYVMGDWLNVPGPNSNVNDYVQPPTSAHVAWTLPINAGGVGGLPSAIDSGGDNYYSYLSYEQMYNPPIIMDGKLFFNTPNPPEYGFEAVDLATGKLVWYQNGTSAWAGLPDTPPPSMFGPSSNSNPIQVGFGFAKQNYPQLSFGQEIDYESPNQHGLIPYLWSTWTAENGSTVWSLFDPQTGNWICNLWNVPGGGAIFGAANTRTDAIGSILSYSLNLASNSSGVSTISVWNSTEAIQNTNPSLAQENGYWMWRPPLGQQIDASNATTTYTVTGTLPASAYAQGPSFFGGFAPLAALVYLDTNGSQAIYSTAAATLGSASYPTSSSYTMFAISIDPATMGRVNWAKTYNWPAGNVTLEGGACNDGIFTMFQKETRLWMGFSATTGESLWTSKTPEVSNHMYGVSPAIYKGVLYSADSIGEGGIIYAYDATTGTSLWQSGPTTMGYTGYWDAIPHSIGALAAGYIFWYGEEHSPGPNLEPGFMIGAINATTGDPVWNITFWSAGGGFGGGMAMADGYMALLNAYDNQIYAFGKGPTATTAETPLAAIIQGQSLVVQGTVMDISAGTRQSAIAARFPNGVPAVSDDNQTAWMEYVYMQNPRPTDTIGVPVSIDIIDPNNNFVHIGDAVSDYSGHYSFQITSSMTPVTGKYTVIATYAGSNSYWPSYTESSFTVDPAPAATPGPQYPAPIDNTMTIIAMGIAIIIAVAIAAILILRKK
jgi:hypothetical protein